MGTQYIIQPNGKWARYSTCSDKLVALDLTEEDIVAMEVREAIEQRTREIRSYLENRKQGRGSQFTILWDRAVKDTKQRSKDKELLTRIGQIERDANGDTGVE